MYNYGPDIFLIYEDNTHKLQILGQWLFLKGRSKGLGWGFANTCNYVFLKKENIINNAES